MVIYWLKQMSISICGCYCKYCNELCYEAPVNDMIVISLEVIIVNATMSCVIKIHGWYVLFSAVCWFIGVIKH